MESRNRDEAKSQILRNKSGSALTLITNSDYGIHPFHRFIQENFIDFKKLNNFHVSEVCQQVIKA